MRYKIRFLSCAPRCQNLGNPGWGAKRHQYSSQPEYHFFNDIQDSRRYSMLTESGSVAVQSRHDLTKGKNIFCGTNTGEVKHGRQWIWKGLSLVSAQLLQRLFSHFPDPSSISSSCYEQAPFWDPVISIGSGSSPYTRNLVIKTYSFFQELSLYLVSCLVSGSYETELRVSHEMWWSCQKWVSNS